MKNILLFLVCSCSLLSVAQETDSLSVTEPMKGGIADIVIDEVTISGTRFEDRPGFNLLATDALGINNGYEVQPVLNQVPGLFMHSGTLSTNRITIRGIGNRSPFGTSKIRAYIEDIPLTSGIGETSLEDIDLSLIDEIEVWKGPTASRYGAGLGGMIHYRIRKPAGPELETNTMIGSAGTFRTTERISLGNGQSGIFISHNHTGSSGWRENSEYRRDGISLVANHKKAHASWTFLFNGIDLYGQIPSSINRDDYIEEPAKAAFTWNQVAGFEDYRKFQAGLSHSRVLQPGWTVRASLFAKGRDAYESRPFNILEEEDHSLGSRITTEYTTGTLVLRAGSELYFENLRWSTFETDLGIQGLKLSDQVEDRNYSNYFIEGTIEINESWTIETGLNINRTRYALNDRFEGDGIDISGNYTYDRVWSPSLNIRYRPAARAIYYLNLSHGFSSPSVEETFNPDGLINEEIGQEKGWNLEGGSRGYFLDGRWTYDLSIYHMTVRDLLVSRFQEDIVTGFDQVIFVNAGKTRHLGLDLFTEFEIYKSGRQSHKLSMAYAYQDFRFTEFTDGTENYSGNELTGTVPHRVFTTLRSEIRPVILILSHQYVDRMPLRDDNTYYSDPYHLFNLRTEVSLMNKERLTIDLYAGINNLFDARYASMLLVNAASFGGNLPRYYYPGQPRNYFSGIRLNWKFN